MRCGPTRRRPAISHSVCPRPPHLHKRAWPQVALTHNCDTYQPSRSRSRPSAHTQFCQLCTQNFPKRHMYTRPPPTPSPAPLQGCMHVLLSSGHGHTYLNFHTVLLSPPTVSCMLVMHDTRGPARSWHLWHLVICNCRGSCTDGLLCLLLCGLGGYGPAVALSDYGAPAIAHAWRAAACSCLSTARAARLQRRGWRHA